MFHRQSYTVRDVCQSDPSTSTCENVYQCTDEHVSVQPINVLVFVPGEVIAREAQHPELFKGCSTKFSKPRFHIIAARRHDSFKSASNEARRLKRKDLKMKKLNAKLLDFGILPPTGDEDLRSTVRDSMTHDVARTYGAVWVRAVVCFLSNAGWWLISLYPPITNSVGVMTGMSLLSNYQLLQLC